MPVPAPAHVPTHVPAPAPAPGAVDPRGPCFGAPIFEPVAARPRLALVALRVWAAAAVRSAAPRTTGVAAAAQQQRDPSSCTQRRDRELQDGESYLPIILLYQCQVIPGQLRFATPTQRTAFLLIVNLV